MAGSGAAGHADGPGAQARLNEPSGVAVGPDGSIYVVDTDNHAIRRIAADAARTVTTLAGGAPSGVPVDGDAVDARLSPQGGLELVGDKLYFSDVGSSRVRSVSLSGEVRTVAGSGRVALQDGSGDGAAFAIPLGLAAGPDGSIWVADSGNGAVRRITP